MSKGSEYRQRRCSSFIASQKFILRSRRLGDLLISSGHLTQGALQCALVHQKTENSNARLGRILIKQRLVSRRALYRTVPNENSVQPMADVIPTRTANLSSSSRDLLESLVTKFADARVFK